MMAQRSKSETELLESIDHRLKMLLKLRVEDKLDEYETNQEKVKVLYELGFDNEDMAELVGTSTGSIRGTLSTLRDKGEIDD